MAYAESTIGGSMGGSFRVYVNSIRTRQGDASNNTEDWHCDGGINRVSTSGGHVWNNFNSSTYTIQLGMNGMATSGNFSYDSTGNGNVLSRGTGTTTVGRDGAGNGFGFTSRTDVNMNNSPYLTSGWVQSSDSVATVPRHAVLTAISTDAGGIPFTDEGPAWIEFNNPSNAAVSAFIDVLGYGRAVTTGAVGSRYNYDFSSTLPGIIQAAVPNSNNYQINIGTLDHVGGGDTYDYRVRDGTIKNDTGQANPTFSNYTYLDTNSTTTAITGNNQYLVQGLSTLEVTVSSGNAATTNKHANRGTYNFTIGAYSQSATWPSTGNVVQTIGTVSDVTGVQSLGVSAVDARGNQKTVSKNVTVLPYQAPGFYGGLDVYYTNEFDYTGGITVDLFNNVTIASVSPLTISSVDKNFVVTSPSGLTFDISKNDNSHYTGTPVAVAITNATDHSGYVNAVESTLAGQILTKMAGMGHDNTTKWFITFSVTDKFQTKSYTVTIDIGRPIMRIGNDGHLYHNEIEMSQAFNNRQTWIEDVRLGFTGTGTWGYGSLTGFLWGFGWCLGNFTTPAIGDYQYHNVFLSKGTYDVMTSFVASTDSAITQMTLIGGEWGAGVPQYNKDNYAASTTENTFNLTNMVVNDATVFTFKYAVVGKNASSSSYVQRLVGIRIRKTA